jgi:hypothetical protein
LRLFKKLISRCGVTHAGTAFFADVRISGSAAAAGVAHRPEALAQALKASAAEAPRPRHAASTYARLRWEAMTDLSPRV